MREESNFSKEIMGEYRPNQKNIVYFPGLSSSRNSRTGRKLKEFFPNEIVITPDIPVNPKDALPFLKNLVSSLKREKTIIVGTSMGGMYAQQMTGFKLILVNPAFHVSQTLKNIKMKRFLFILKEKIELRNLL